MSAAAASMKPHKDGTLIALEDAVQDAHDHVRGMPAESEWQAIYFGGGLRRVYFRLPNERGHNILDVEVAYLVDRFGPCLVSAVFQLAAGANRVVSLIHLLELNKAHVSPAI